ncbi:hypothetical protein ACP4OV_002314 [Aristida adscensionis]
MTIHPLNNLATLQNAREEKLVAPPGMEDRLARLQYLREQKGFHNVTEAELVVPPEIKDRLARLQNLRQGKLIVQGKKPAVEEQLGELNRMLDRQEVLLKELEEVITDKIKRKRRRQILFRTSIAIGLAIYVKKYLFGSWQEDDEKQLDPVW